MNTEDENNLEAQCPKAKCPDMHCSKNVVENELFNMPINYFYMRDFLNHICKWCIREHNKSK